MLLNQYLNSLGNTSEEVAASLRTQQIKGRKNDVRLCPILNGIYQACPDYWSGLRIHGGRKRKSGDHWHYSATLNDSQILDPTLPQPVMDFIGDFDSGKYPDLEAKEVRVVATRVWT